MDYRKRRTEHAPILIDWAVVEQVPWCPHHQQMNMVQTHQDSCEEGRTTRITPQETEKIWHESSDPQTFYSCTIESILTGCITAWYCNCSASCRKTLQRVVRMAQYITGAKHPAIQDLCTRQSQRKALKMVKDSSHPSHRLFSLLLQGKRYQSAKSRSKRLLNSFLTASTLKP